MTSFRLTLAAALLTGASFTAATAVETKPVTNPAASTEAAATAPRPSNQAATNNNAQAGANDLGQNAAPNMQAQNQANPANSNVQMAANTVSTAGISSDASPTQVKEARLKGSAAKKKSFNEQAETTKELNQQAAQLARNG
jgi:hypothetical protein